MPRGSDDRVRTTEILINSPEQDLLNLMSKNWESVLRQQNFPTSEIDAATHLINCFVQGMADAYHLKKRQKKIPNDFIFPQLIILPVPDGKDEAYWYAEVSRQPKYYAINLNNQILKEFAGYDPTDTLDLSTAYDEKFWTGSIEDTFRDGGREEMDHIIKDQQWPDLDGYSADAGTAHLVDYDAADAEYYALGTRVRAAIDRDVPPKTIDLLLKRLRDAAQLRRQKKH